MPYSVLIVDDEVTFARNVTKYLSRHGYETRSCNDGAEALEALETYKPDLVLLDYALPGADGLEILKQIRARDTQTKVIMMTGQGSVQIAVDAMKNGAQDYLCKPLVLAELRLMLDKCIGQERREGALAYYQRKQAQQSGLAKLIGESTSMVALKSRIQHLIEAERRLKDVDSPPVLITGASGTGKELVARALHFDGPRCERPFIEVNCASFPADLIEAELFGYERGAFTDAKNRKLGLLEAADGGSLFLDEIGDMDINLQAKLLRVLEDKRVRRVGGVQDRPVDIRVISATNQNLEERVRQGTFRSDLLFRLRVIHIELPPLHERDDDVLLLANAFLHEQAQRYSKGSLSFTKAAEQGLRKYCWPGNVRELRNAIEHAVLLSQSNTITTEQLPFPSCPGFAHSSRSPETDVVNHQRNNAVVIKEIPEEGIDIEEVEKNLLTQALEHTDWNVTRAAKLLGLTRDTLRYRMGKNNLRPPS